jgi:hypothetical protein
MSTESFRGLRSGSQLSTRNASNLHPDQRLHDGIKILRHLGEPATDEFIWVRAYKDKAELEAKNKKFQAAVAAARVKLGGNVAKLEVRRRIGVRLEECRCSMSDLLV